ncbi:MAG: 5'/3'-nucleotidase SurE [Planctomycetia bacterium]
MRILLTNDDGIYSPGLAALDRHLRELGEVDVVAPVTEQSGVSHSITFLTPLIVKEVYHGAKHWGWAVEGSPADCVKLGMVRFCDKKPDLVVSGINGGLNAGINVLYSGTVAGALEGAVFETPSVAVSLEFDPEADYDTAAALAVQLIRTILERRAKAESEEKPSLVYNINIPLAALKGDPRVEVVPMDLTRYGDRFDERSDPWGRDYFWVNGSAPESTGQGTDLAAVSRGNVAITPLSFDLTARRAIRDMESWSFSLEPTERSTPANGPHPQGPVVRAMRKMQQIRVSE